MEVTIAFWDHGPISHLHLEMIPSLTVHAQLKSLETNAKQERITVFSLCTRNWIRTSCRTVMSLWTNITKGFIYRVLKCRTSIVPQPPGNECLAGHECPLGSPDQTACSSGYYQPLAGQGQCIICPGGSYCDQNEAISEQQSGGGAPSHGVVTPKGKLLVEKSAKESEHFNLRQIQGIETNFSEGGILVCTLTLASQWLIVTRRASCLIRTS
jgi:hypothetical protein